MDAEKYDNNERYIRQILIEDFGERGQKKLMDSTVAIVGVGGLGTVVSQYLAAAGVGKLILIDYQKVELSNLNRQILHYEKDIGKLKVDSAKEKLELLNPTIEIEIYSEKLKEKHIKNADVVVDCLDNFSSRYFLNEIAFKNNIPFVHGAIEEFRGQVTTIVPYETPCLKCIFNLKDEDRTFPVMGVTPGVIGSIQASEVIKLLSNIDETLKNKLLLVNLRNNEYITLNIKKNPKCSVCGGGI